MCDAETHWLAELQAERAKFSSRSRNMVLIVLLVACLAILSHVFSLDAVCAPVMPGTIIKDTEATMDAPWIAPLVIKESAFAAICGSRPRTRLSWVNGKLSAYSLIGSDARMLWSKRASAATVSTSKISLQGKNGEDVGMVEAPWSLR
jgi:hypothetical protein